MNFKLLLKTSAIAVCFTCFFAISDAIAQDFVSDGASADYNATCGAVIRMKGNASEFVNNGGALLGTNAANTIPGVVDWTATGGAQTIQGLYYELLYSSGTSTKDVEDGVFVMGGSCATFLPGYDDLATYSYFATGGGRTYNGTFTYGGSVAQNIFGEQTGASGTDYNILALSGGGTKTILGTDDVGTAVNISSDAATTLAIVGQLYTGTATSTLDGEVEFNDVDAELIVGTGAVNLNADVDVNSGTISAATGAGIVTVGAAATMTLGGDDSFLDFADNTNLTITGDIINSGNGLNLLFACLSTVTYDGTQNPQLVMPTLTSNSYGNLVLTNGAKRGDAAANYANDIFLCNNFALTGGNFDMFTNSGVLTMLAVAGTATYGGGPGNEEVVGSMARTMDAAAGSYVFNNRNTTIDLDADAANPTLATIEMRPGQGASMGAWVVATDVNRSVNLTHNAAADFEMELAVGYLFSEGPGGWAPPNEQTTIRFHEGEFGTADEEKIGTGQVYNRTAAAGADLGQISLAGILRAPAQALPNDLDRFASGNDVILRAGPTTFYTVDDGRWTNPNTWDEGTQPSSLDDTEIRHAVYVGIDGPFIGTPGGADGVAANNTLAESDHYGALDAARTINIASGYANASLIIGNEDNPASYIFHTSFDGGSSFLNNNTNAPTAAFPYAIAKASAAKADFNGLWLINSLGAGTPGFGTFQIANTGTINNEGVIEVGE